MSKMEKLEKATFVSVGLMIGLAILSLVVALATNNGTILVLGFTIVPFVILCGHFAYIISEDLL